MRKRDTFEIENDEKSPAVDRTDSNTNAASETKDNLYSSNNILAGLFSFKKYLLLLFLVLVGLILFRVKTTNKNTNLPEVKFPKRIILDESSSFHETSIGDDIHSKLKAFYLKYNPERVSDIPNILVRYEGKIDHLLDKLKAKYGVDPLTLAPTENLKSNKINLRTDTRTGKMNYLKEKQENDDENDLLMNFNEAKRSFIEEPLNSQQKTKKNSIEAIIEEFVKNYGNQ